MIDPDCVCHKLRKGINGFSFEEGQTVACDPVTSASSLIKQPARLTLLSGHQSRQATEAVAAAATNLRPGWCSERPGPRPYAPFATHLAVNLKHLQPYTQQILVSSVPCTSGPRRSCRKQESRRGRTRPTPGRCNQHCHFFLGFLSPVCVWVGNVCLHISIDIYVYVYIDIDIEI